MKKKESKENFSLTGALLPREELLEIVRRRKKLTIGILSELDENEKRVPLTPESCNLLVESGNEILIQSGAGKGCNYNDNNYSENGVIIARSAEEILQCDVLIKVAPLSLHEIQNLKGNQIILSYLNILKQTEDNVKALIRKNITALAFEKIRDSNDELPVVESMSEISGITSVLIASEYLSNQHGGKGVMLGGIAGVTPTEVVIIGAGTAGEYAARAALGLGSVVRIFDHSVHNLRKFQSLVGQRLQTSVYHPQVIRKALKTADVLIGAIQIEDIRPWYKIPEDVVMNMKKGSFVIDLSLDRGGCIETTECRGLSDPVYEKYGIIHFSAWNLPSRVARTASIALSNIFTPLLQEVSDAGGLDVMLKTARGLSDGVYIYRGILTSEPLGQRFGILSKDINLLLAAF